MLFNSLTPGLVAEQVVYPSLSLSSRGRLLANFVVLHKLRVSGEKNKRLAAQKAGCGGSKQHTHTREAAP